MTIPIVKTATASDEAPAIDVVVRAFNADPAARWTWPDSQQYLMHFPPFVQAFGGKAFTHGSAYYVDGYAGAALWLPPDVHPDEDALITLLQRTVSEQIQKDVFAVFEQMGRYHPSEPHWFLPLMSVDPFQQGRGYDRERATAALRTHSADLVSFGRLFLANPDLPERLARHAPLNTPDPATFYGGDARGYTDYPTFSAPVGQALNLGKVA